MMNMTRGEPFTVDISFDCEVAALRDFALIFFQRGSPLLTKSMKDAAVDDTGYRASVALSGEETALFQPCDPAWAQVRAVLANGENLHSEAREINIVDVLDA